MRNNPYVAMDNLWWRLWRCSHGNALRVFPERLRRVRPGVALWPSNAHGQATLGGGSVNFGTVGFGDAVFNGSCCVLFGLSDTWALRCRMVMFCGGEVDWGMMAFVA